MRLEAAAEVWGMAGASAWITAAAGGGLSFEEGVAVVPEGGAALGAMQLRMGYDASADAAWEIDLCGAKMPIEGEEKEMVVLAAWFRTGQWRPALERGELEAEEVDGTHWVVRRRGGALEGRATFDDDGRPTELVVEGARGTERWTYAAPWREAPGGREQASVLTYFPAAGGRSIFEASGHATLAEGAADYAAAAYDDAQVIYGAEAPAWAECCRGEGGQILAKAAVEGGDGAGKAEPGWFCIDSAGTTTATVSKRVADELGWERFGEVHLNAVGDTSMCCSLRRCASLQLGQVTLLKPVFLECEISDVVRPAKTVRGPQAKSVANYAKRSTDLDAVCVGSIGGPLLHRAVIELRLGRREPGGSKPGRVDLAVHAPQGYAFPTARAEAAVQRLGFEYGVPMADCVLRARDAGGGEDEYDTRSVWVETGVPDEVPLMAPDPKGDFAERSRAIQDTATPAAPAEPGALGAQRWAPNSGVELCRLALHTGVGGVGLVLKGQTAFRLGMDDFFLRPEGMAAGPGEKQARFVSVGQEIPGLRPARKDRGAPQKESVHSSWVQAAEFKGRTFRGVRTIVHATTPRDAELARAAGGFAAAQLLLAPGTRLVLDLGGRRLSLTALGEYE